jgi:monovalent cation:H+ antiporter-2, CPA2 family
MPHQTPLIATIVIGLVLAFALGAVAIRLRTSPIVGYLISGVLVGPHTPGFVADQALAAQLAEIGVILLMFGVGLHFSLKELLSVKTIAIPGAIGQMTIATALGLGLGLALGWSTGAGIVFGLALSVASTVVMMRALQERHVLDSERGRIAMGWLIVEDLAMVLVLVLLPALSGVIGGEAAPVDRSTEISGIPPIVTTLAITIGKVVAFVALMLLVGRRLIPWLLHHVVHTGSRELFRLAVLAILLGVAYGCALLFDVSFALGAFFAGMILSESELSQRAAEETLPLRDAFAVLFFISVGMLFDPGILVRDPWPVLATVFIIMVMNPIVAFLIVLAFRRPFATAIMIGASVAQIGEFSFILAGLGVALKLLPETGRDLILAGAILSIMANPVLFAATDWIQRKRLAAAGPPGAAAPASEPAPLEPTPLKDHAVLIGYGRVGAAVGDALRRGSQPFLVVETNLDIVAPLRAAGVEAFCGNAADPALIEAANVAGARLLFVAIPNAFEAGQIVQRARRANPSLKIIARAHFDAEIEHLRGLGADAIIMGEREIAGAMVAEAFGQRPAATS